MTPMIFSSVLRCSSFFSKPFLFFFFRQHQLPGLSKKSKAALTTMTPPFEHNTETESTSSEVLLADSFPSKAFLVIEYCDSTDANVACWSDDGTHFIVKDTSTFAASHLPRYFKHSNFQSFIRQLNGYGFRKRSNENNNDGSVAFHHKYFSRGRPDLLKHISRSTLR